MTTRLFFIVEDLVFICHIYLQINMIFNYSLFIMIIQVTALLICYLKYKRIIYVLDSSAVVLGQMYFWHIVITFDWHDTNIWLMSLCDSSVDLLHRSASCSLITIWGQNTEISFNIVFQPYHSNKICILSQFRRINFSRHVYFIDAEGSKYILISDSGTICWLIACGTFFLYRFPPAL